MSPVTLFVLQAAPARPWQQDLLSTLTMMAMIFGIFYFLLIRPQQRQVREHRKLLASLQKGDNILFSGGIYGRIAEVADKVLTVEIADKVKIRVNLESVNGVIRADGKVEEITKEGNRK